MTPGAHLQETMSALYDYESLLLQERYVPSDRFLQGFFRSRRYMGSTDRKEVALLFYGVIRRRQTLSWWLEKYPLSSEPSLMDKSRWTVFAYKILSGQSSLNTLTDLPPSPYHPSPLTSREIKSLKNLNPEKGWDHPDMPSWIQGCYPEFLDPVFSQIFGDRKTREMEALLEEAPLDLRVNLLQSSVKEVSDSLKKQGLSPLSCPSPWGIRLQGRPPLVQFPVYQKGCVEIQDAASQWVSLLVQAQPGQTVLDLCAGAGGKTLALAMTMHNKGILIATDVYEKRLKEGKLRFRRNGVHNVQTRVIDPHHDSWLKRQKDRFDRVLVDAPCSGTGTWRRNPDLRWRFTAQDLADLQETQAQILRRAAPLVKPGGHLIYATCSLLPQENEAQIEKFLAEFSSFSPINPQDLEPSLPEYLPSFKGPFFKTTPLQHDMDGFFGAVLQKG